MARVVVTVRARNDLDGLIRTHSLPSTTRDRVIRSSAPLADFPALGAPLHGRWAPRRFVLGPWRWLLMVYLVEPDRDLVIVVAIVDGRTAGSPTIDRDGSRRDPRHGPPMPLGPAARARPP